jgi:hypothetical protein
MQFFNVVIFADEYDNIFDITQNTIGESIEWRYINKTSSHIIPNIVRDCDENKNNLDSISIGIYFNAGVYGLKDYFNNIIENKLLIELKNIFHNYDISISMFYPFSIILLNNFNYELDERQSIIKEIEKNTHGIMVEHIFQNSILGYFEDNFFCNLSETRNRVDQLIHNNFNLFMEIIYRYFDKGNIISF